MTRWLAITAGTLLIASAPPLPAADPLSTVNMRTGNFGIGEGATLVGPALPFGSISPGPNSPEGYSTGYKAGQPIRGFAQTHVSGTGWGQYGNLLVSPRIGLATLPPEHDSPAADERPTPFEYQVRLARWNTEVRFTPGHHAAIYQFDFPAAADAHVVVNTVHHIPGDIAKAMFASLQRPVPARVSLAADGRGAWGESRYSGGFGGPYTLFWQIEFDRAPAAHGTFRDAEVQPGATTIEASGRREQLGFWLRFDTREQPRVQMKVAVSFHSVERARERLAREIPAFDYAAVRDAAAARWRDALAAFAIEGGSPQQRSQFFTAAYHLQLMPRQRSGEFARFDPAVPMWDDHYAIWDTWRTMFPLLVLIRPDIVRDTVHSFVERQRVDGAVADTFIAGVNMRREQGGNAVDQIIADAYVKNVPGIDWRAAYAVLRHNAEHRRNGPHFDDPRRGPGPYRSTGWIPEGMMSTSMSLEYSYNDFVASLVAEGLGESDDAARWRARSRLWTELWNPATESDGFRGFVMSRRADGSWVDFDTRQYAGSWKPWLYESNAWTYSYFAPHQIARLVQLMGGRERFVQRLEHALDKGYIDLFNEPSFLVPQTFHHVGRPDLAARWTRRITGDKFTPQGYPGDDDSGAMSSYYVWSRMGLFPNAGQDFYYVNGPVFERMTVRRPGHAPLLITRRGAGGYVAGVTLDGRPLARSWLRHAELMKTRTLAFTMSERPTTWARDGEPPPSLP